MHAVAIGPWVFAIGLVALVLGWVAANVAALIMRRRTHVDAGTPLWVLLLLALVVSRAVFVIRGWHAYAAAPASIIDIRDGGFSWAAGVAVLVAGALLWMWRRPALRRPLSVSAGAGLALWAVVAFGAPRLGAHSAVPPLPGVALQQLDGQPVRLTALEGKPMIVNIWATWCAPCRSEMPMLVAASHQLHDVRFVFVDHGEPAGAVRHYLAQTGLDPAHVVLDTRGQLMHDYKLPGCPATLFVAPSGAVRDVHLGVLSAAALRVDIRHYLTRAAA
ncbi:MAG TPA: TlpA disulfide reductase family protein [Rhodanobacteraceae bacterium]